MTAQELRELDAWIAEHVMGWELNNVSELWKIGPSSFRNFHPTLLAADAMDVLKKCAEKGATIQIYVSAITGKWCCMRDEVTGVCEQVIEESETLELAICKIAKQLFSKTTK